MVHSSPSSTFLVWGGRKIAHIFLPHPRSTAGRAAKIVIHHVRWQGHDDGGLVVAALGPRGTWWFCTVMVVVGGRERQNWGRVE